MREERIFRTFQAKVHLQGNDSPLMKVFAKAFEEAITSVSVGIYSLLTIIQKCLALSQDDDGLVCADLVLTCLPKDTERAKGNIAKVVPEPRPNRKGEITARTLAEPRYSNSYRLIEIFSDNGLDKIRFRLAERFQYEDARGNKRQAITRLPAQILQGMLRSWLKVDLSSVPKDLRDGVYQKAAEQLNSFIELVAGQEQAPSFPSLLERNPTLRLESWKESLGRIAGNRQGFEYKSQRELNPSKFSSGDARGNRMVNVDPDWVNFSRSPFPRRFPGNFVRSDAVRVFWRRWAERATRGELQKERLYACIPLFAGVASDSSLGRLAEEEKLFWWQKHRDEFEALPAFGKVSLPKGNTAVLVPLEYYNPRSGREPILESVLSDPRREVCWSLLVERPTLHRQRHGKKRRLYDHGREWYLDFATATKVLETPKRPNVLGIHFQPEPMISWALAGPDRSILDRGQIPGNPVLSEALAKKLRLEEDQKGYRWVGDKKFRKQLKQRTYEVARSILDLAVQKNASLAIENISWVDKRSGNASENSRFSLWNFSDLAGLLKWLSMERPEYRIPVAEVSDYILHLTCPSCSACRKSGQLKGKADTWLEAGVLHCRKCGFEGKRTPSEMAEFVVMSVRAA